MTSMFAMYVPLGWYDACPEVCTGSLLVGLLRKLRLLSTFHYLTYEVLVQIRVADRMRRAIGMRGGVLSSLYF